jgi:serine phosphatase RsbU (regulator of sigma subunit)
LGILELAAAHQEALEGALGRSLSPEARGRLAKTSEFFLQCLSPFEMVHRGVKEANVTLGRLHHALEQHVLEQQLLHRELEFAREVQKHFLPSSVPRVPGYHFSHYYQPAREVGGDYFDYMYLPGHRLAVSIGDVAGKGMPAALLMARVLAEQRYCLLAERTTAEALTRLNGQLAQCVPEGRFVTCVLLVLEPEAHRATLANAGHPPPLLRRSGSPVAEPLGAAEVDLPLGVDAHLSYTQAEVTLQGGDVITLFTDGLTEAQNLSGGFYQSRRLAGLLALGPNQVGSLAEAILQDVKRFAAGNEPGDDLTLICFGRESS